MQNWKQVPIGALETLYSVVTEGSFPVNSEDYTDLYDYLSDLYCDQDRVCCPQDNVRSLLNHISTFYDNFSWKSTRDKMFVDQKKQENTPGWLALWDTVLDSLLSYLLHWILIDFYDLVIIIYDHAFQRRESNIFRKQKQKTIMWRSCGSRQVFLND